MEIPAFKVKVEEYEENGHVFYRLKHTYARGEFQGLPANEPYATEDEAIEARARFVKIVEETLGDE